MEYYSRMSTTRFRRITIRFSFIEIEFRTRARPTREPVSKEEKAYHRALVEEAIARQHYDVEARIMMHV